MPTEKSRSWQFVQPLYADIVPDGEYGDFRPESPPPTMQITFGRGQVQLCDDSSYEFVGYVESKLQLSIGAMKKWLPEARFTKTDIPNREMSIAEVYSESKRVESSLPIPWGIGTDKSNKTPGQRNDLNDIKDILKADGPVRGVKRVAEEFPGQFMRYHAGIEKLANILEETPRDQEFVPNPFQKAMIEELQAEPHNRHIYWVYDQAGHSGKSRLLTHLVAEMGAIELGGREVDIAYGYNGERIVCFDIPRPTPLNSYADAFVCAERLKNGAIFSTKFMCKFKKFAPPHVVFFSNNPPPEGLWTKDRLQLITLSTPPPAFMPFTLFGAPPPIVELPTETRAQIIQKRIDELKNN
jgi:hypothetical protein